MVKTNMPPQKFRKRNDIFFNKTQNREGISQTCTPKSSSFLIASPLDHGNRRLDGKKFDKNKWRTQKYNHKSKVQKWQNRRSEDIRHKYLKEQRRGKKPVDFDVQKMYEEEERREKEETNLTNKKDNSGEFDKEILKKIRNRKSNIKAEIVENNKTEKQFLKIKIDKEMATKQYRKKKLEKHKKLDKKTQRGQPVMKGRMELLLERIQENLNS